MAKGFMLEKWLDREVSVHLVREGGSEGAAHPQFATWPITGQLKGISEWGVMVMEESGAEEQRSSTMKFYPWGAVRSIQRAPEERAQGS
jgi:hypothetical protein